jgi:hypothetical protein
MPTDASFVRAISCLPPRGPSNTIGAPSLLKARRPSSTHTELGQDSSPRLSANTHMSLDRAQRIGDGTPCLGKRLIIVRE